MRRSRCGLPAQEIVSTPSMGTRKTPLLFPLRCNRFSTPYRPSGAWALLTVSYVTETGSSWVRSVSWSPDGKLLASGSDDKTVRVWSAEDGSCAKVLSGHRYATAAIPCMYQP